MMRSATVSKSDAEETEFPGAISAEMDRIERVSAFLRRVQPDLEMRDEGVPSEPITPPGPAWLAVGGVWISTLIVIGLAVAGAALFVR
jgi:hypothetical protein